MKQVPKPRISRHFDPHETEILALQPVELADLVVLGKRVVKYGAHRPDEAPLVWHSDYWECECARDYLHHESIGNHCPLCGVFREEIP